MKNQYFGDVNDYRKYGLLRTLIEVSGLKLGVCWLLTKNDGRTDGEFRRYLEEPERWRRFDPELYDKLLQLNQLAAKRDVHNAELWGILPGATFFDAPLVDSAVARDKYFSDAWRHLAECPLMFFDPDNGIEVSSKPRGSVGSSKYLYWVEIERAYASGHSLLIYQHYPRRPRLEFRCKCASELARRLEAPAVQSFATAHVVFFLVVRPEHSVPFTGADKLVMSRWCNQFTHESHGPTRREAAWECTRSDGRKELHRPLCRTSPSPWRTLADLLEELGGVPPERVACDPAPGTATEADVLTRPDGEKRLVELVDGVLVQKPLDYYVSHVTVLLIARLETYAHSEDLGITLGPDAPLRLGPGLVRLPDASFISWKRFPNHLLPAEPILDMAPDLAVEVLSAGNTTREMERKLREYFAAGARLVWMVDPDARTVRVHTSPTESLLLSENDTLDGGDVLPGFSLSLRQWFDQAARRDR